MINKIYLLAHAFVVILVILTLMSVFLGLCEHFYSVTAKYGYKIGPDRDWETR